MTQHELARLDQKLDEQIRIAQANMAADQRRIAEDDPCYAVAMFDQGELLDCPFCGGEAEMRPRIQDPILRFEVACDGTCNLEMTGSDIEALKDEWNLRPQSTMANELERESFHAVGLLREAAAMLEILAAGDYGHKQKVRFREHAAVLEGKLSGSVFL